MADSPSICEALDSKPIIAKEKKRTKEKRGRRKQTNESNKQIRERH